MAKLNRIMRNIIEIMTVILILMILFYFSLVVKIFIAEHKIIFNIFEYEGLHVYIGIAIIAVIVVLLRDHIDKYLNKISKKG